MEGLEITIKYFHELSDGSDNTLRCDPDHYQKKYTLIKNRLERHTVLKLKDVIKCPVITGHTPSMKLERFYGGNIPFVKTDNLRENKIVGPFSDYLTKEGNQKIKNSELKAGDIILTIIGATFAVVGRSALVRKQNIPANINQNIALIRIDQSKISVNYLSLYLNTKYGRGILHYYSRQTEQVNLNCREVEKILIPIFYKLSSKIEFLSNEIDRLLEQAKYLYAKAEERLLSEIRLRNFAPSTKSVSIKSFKESFEQTKRLDAEYYHQKYEEIIAKVKKRSNNILINLVTISKSVEPGSNYYAEEGLPFIRVADYSKYGLTKPQKYLSDSYVKENKKLLDKLKPRKDSILFSKDGSVGIAYHLREDIEAITSGAILHLVVKDKEQIIPEYLTLVLNSKIVQMQAERDSGGSIILHWRVSEIEKVVIPIIAYTKQQEIAALIDQSFALKKQSEKFLDVAKRAIEIAIEKDEETALKFLETIQK